MCYEKSMTWNRTRIRALRRSFGDTQEAFAHRLGVSFVTVSRWEGGNKPSRMAVTLLDALAAKKPRAQRKS